MSGDNEVKKEWMVIGRGFSGWHAKSDNCSSSGGNLLPYTYWTGQKCSGYLAGAKDGCFVYDARHLEGTNSEAFIEFVFSGPLCEVDMPAGTICKMLEKPRDYIPGENVGSLDKVSRDIWVAKIINLVPGLKFGYVKNGEIAWDTEPPEFP